MPSRPPSDHVAPVADVETSPWAPRHRAVMAGMVALIALSAFEALAVTTVMPAVVAALGGLSLYAVAFAAPVASGVVGMVAAGGWADRAGPSRPLVTGTGLFVLGLLLAGLAPSMLGVVGGRLVQGLGAGAITVCLYLLVAQLFGEQARARAFAAFAAAWVLPALIGPALAGLVADTVGWRWVFLGVPVLVVPALVLLRPALRALPVEPTEPAAGARGRLGLAVLAGAGALVLHLAAQGGPAVTVVALAAGLTLLALTAPRLMPPGTFRGARGLPAVIAVRGLVGAAFFGAEVYLPLVLQTERGLGAGTTGIALTVAAVLWSAGSWLRGHSGTRWSDPHLLLVGAASLTAGIALGAAAVLPAVPVPVSLLGWGLAGLGMGLIYPTLSLLTLRLAAPAEQGAATSALQVMESLAVVVVLALSGRAFTALVDGDPVMAFAVCFAFPAACALAAAALSRRVTTG